MVSDQQYNAALDILNSESTEGSRAYTGENTIGHYWNTYYPGYNPVYVYPTTFTYMHHHDLERYMFALELIAQGDMNYDQLVWVARKALEKK